ncbi:MAG: hypothetical protein L0H15_02820 [Nitrosospira sp.]|nr:hypothetical protein [Nitrosospira sp.]MDN5935172.1 hypothetical protein [Nitrosospira sp.]
MAVALRMKREVLTEAQVSALEKKQDGLSFTTGNAHAFITGPKGWV